MVCGVGRRTTAAPEGAKLMVFGARGGWPRWQVEADAAFGADVGPAGADAGDGDGEVMLRCARRWSDHLQLLGHRAIGGKGFGESEHAPTLAALEVTKRWSKTTDDLQISGYLQRCPPASSRGDGDGARVGGATPGWGHISTNVRRGKDDGADTETVVIGRQ